MLEEYKYNRQQILYRNDHMVINYNVTNQRQEYVFILCTASYSNLEKEYVKVTFKLGSFLVHSLSYVLMAKKKRPHQIRLSDFLNNFA